MESCEPTRYLREYRLKISATGMAGRLGRKTRWPCGWMVFHFLQGCDLHIRQIQFMLRIIYVAVHLLLRERTQRAAMLVSWCKLHLEELISKRSQAAKVVLQLPLSSICLSISGFAGSLGTKETATICRSLQLYAQNPRRYPVSRYQVSIPRFQGSF